MTYVFFDNDDLTLLERKLGSSHPLTKRLHDALADLCDPLSVRYREAADNFDRDGDLEIDPNGIVSKGDDAGAYVMAWIWIDDNELATPAKRRPS